MKSVLFYLLQVIICSGVLYGYYYLFLRNKNFHQYNRFYLLAVVVLSFIIPSLGIPVYFTPENQHSFNIYQTLTVFSDNENEQLFISSNNSGPDTSVFGWQQVAWLIYILVCVVILIKFIIAINKIRILSKKYNVEKLDDIYFINTDEAGTPYSFFRWLFWNKRIPLQSENGRKIFRHELFHIQQKHSLDIVFMEFLTVLFWINPFYHFIKTEIKAIHEFLADKFAAKDAEDWNYATLLLMQALGTQTNYLSNPFFHNKIKRRIAMITTSQKPRYRYLRKIMVLPIAALIISLFAFKYKNRAANFTSVTNHNPITVVIDAGHGGKDAGVIVKGKMEKDITLSIAKKIRELNKSENIKLLFTRIDDLFTSPKEDVVIADNADLLISLHVNAATKSESVKTGIEVYVSSKKENDYKSHTMAAAVINELQNTYNTNRNILKRDKAGIAVLDLPKCPAVLIEFGYMTNPDDFAFITNEENQEKIASNILDAITKYAVLQVEDIREEMATVTFDSDKKSGEQVATYSGKVIREISIHEATGQLVLMFDNQLQTLSKEKSASFKKEYWPRLKHLYKPLRELEDIKVTRQAPDTIKPKTEQALIVIDGKIQEGLKLAEIEQKINANDVLSVNVIKGKDAIVKYGDKGKNGVIEITTKKEIGAAQEPIIGTEPIFEKVEIEPSFPGSQVGLRKFLEKNLNASIPAKNKAPGGTYTVLARFVVDTAGVISDVKTLTNHGYGMEEEIRRVIKLYPKWNSAIQNGKKVKAYKKQPITFVVSKDPSL